MKINFLLPVLALSVCSCANKPNNAEQSQDSTLVAADSTAEVSALPANMVTDSFVVNNVTYKMVKVEGGKYVMGASVDEKGVADGDEYPAHNVNISSFYIGQFEVTQKLWQDVMGNNPSETKGENNPVDKVSWNDCNEFIARLNKLTGKTFRMPTEAEWEFAARGGVDSKGYIYSGSNNIDAVAWYDANEDGQTHAVGQKQPNELGIYDMSGNVGEWCSDWYEDGAYAKSDKENPKGPAKGDYHVLRGNGWFSSTAGYNRIANRSGNEAGYRYKFLGLRLAM